MSYHSPAGGHDDCNKAPRLKAALQKRGPWTFVDSWPEEDDPRRVEAVQWFIWHVPGSLSTSVTLRCSVPSPEPAAPIGKAMTKAEHVRLTAWRLRVLRQAADDGNVARVCRRFGISRKSFCEDPSSGPPAGTLI